MVDFKGNNDNIKRAKFINCFLGIDIRNFLEFIDIENFRKIRNLLIHKNLNLRIGKKEKQYEKLLSIIFKNQYLSVDMKSGKIYEENLNYIKNFKDQVKFLFQKLIKEIRI